VKNKENDEQISKEDAREAKKAKGKTKTGILVILFLLITLLLGFIYFLIVIKDISPIDKVKNQVEKLTGLGNDKGVKDGDIDMNAVKEIKVGLQEKADKSKVTNSININPVVKDGVGNFLIRNVATNSCLLEITITSEDKTEVYYKSPALKPNQYIETDKLLKPLAVGTYKAIASFKAYNSTTLEKMGESGTRITLTVQN